MRQARTCSARDVVLVEVDTRMLVREASRAALQRGLPSAVLSNVADGWVQAVEECANEEDRAYLVSALASLVALRDDLRAREHAIYSGPASNARAASKESEG